jgi:two-component system phosphate regulon sensor histidine kinase PhoR
MTVRIFVKLLLAGLGVLVVALAAVDFLTARVTEQFYVNNLKQDLAEKGRMLVLLHPDFTQVPAGSLARAAGVRVTAIDADGKVVADSDTDPSHMENHGLRPEVVEALKGGVGSATRVSASLGVETLYVAIPSSNGVLRLSVRCRECGNRSPRSARKCSPRRHSRSCLRFCSRHSYRVKCRGGWRT